MPHIRKALMLACSLAFASGTVHAEDQAVMHRLAAKGKVRGKKATALVAKVNQRLARAADMPPTMVDPVRVSLSQAMLGTPVAGDTVSAAKVRLKLYAGLSEYTLEAMFSPRKGAIADCERDVGLNTKDCTALIAAAGNLRLAKAKKVGAGPASAPVQVAAAPVANTTSSAQASNSTASRFGSRFNSGYQPAAAPQRAAPVEAAAPQQLARAPQPAPVQQQQLARAPQAAPVQQQAAPRFAAAPAASAAPAYVASAAPAPAAPAPDPAAVQDAKSAYKAQREAYLARQRAQFEERRAKLAGANAPPPEAAPAPRPAAVAAAAAPEQAEPETALDADMKAAVPEAAKAPAPGKAGLDGDFLDGLLDDPTGGAKKK